MYAIIHNNQVLSICEAIPYVKRNPVKSSPAKFIKSGIERARGVMINGTVYAIKGFGKIPYEGAPVAEIKEIQGASKYIYDAFVKSLQVEKDANDLNDAIIDMSGTTQEQIDDLTDAIFELAAQINS